MIKKEISILLMIVIVFNVFTICIFGKENYKTIDPKQWLGIREEDMPNFKNDLRPQDLVFIKNEEHKITDIFIKNPQVKVDSIAVGDTVDKVLKVYPKEWIVTTPSYMLVLKGREKSFGIATQYILYLVAGKKVKEIQLGYTADFLQGEWPLSNAYAERLLQGKWTSEKHTTIKFKMGHLEDNLLESLYDDQQYEVISPNKLLIRRYKDGLVEKKNLRFFVDEKTLYIFDINQLGIPIKETIEEFVMR